MYTIEELYKSNNVLGYDCNNNEIKEFRLVKEKNIKESIAIENVRTYCVVIAEDEKPYAISVDDIYFERIIRQIEEIPEDEEIPVVVNKIEEMKDYEGIVNYCEEPIFYRYDKELLKVKLNNLLKQKPKEKTYCKQN